MAGVRNNFAYNLLLTVSNYLFPLIVYPYVSRVLGVENIGVCGFVDGIINYFVLFSQLGIGSYGVREIARCKDDPVRLEEVFSNLFLLNLITFAVSAVTLVICTFTVPKLLPYRPFLMVGLLKLVFSLFLVEWFFQGVEQFRYITLRSIAVRTLYVIAVFALVRNAGDTLVYYAITVGTVVLNAIINWRHTRRFSRLRPARFHPAPFLVPILVFGYYRILTSMYTTFNTVYLGFVKDNAEVGFFTQATKLYSLIMAVFTAFTTVMVPRVSAMLHEGRKSELGAVINRIVHLLVALAVPAIVLCVVNAPAIVYLVSGPGYEGAETPFRIVIFMLLVIGMEQIVIQQCLMASENTKPTLYVSSVGAIVGITLNVILTPRLGAVGSAVSWGISELSVLIVGLFFLWKELRLQISRTDFFRPLFFGMAYVIPAVACLHWMPNLWWRLGISIALTVPIFFLINLRWDANTLLDEMKLVLARFRR